ncbi:hypothetical protein KIN20_008155 [Parelaphostrongylus tenuis]|uniref:Lipoprotein n=1 Tax=Parelaphostrongylus tenuis TaxID=148309 RepID=A0AAD5QHA4_PARTN|nr:hypothetical protein KIN20_008155 [Parelaphostrongylus tenuis]
MPRFLINPFMTALLATTSTVFGCGVMPAGQANSRTFTVTGFTLPVAMAYTDTPAISTQLGGIATSKGRAEAFVSRLVMQTVFDVLESQARSALLPDAMITAILSQLTVNATYEPLLCQKVAINLMDAMDRDANQNKPQSYCIIIDNTVTGICTKKEAKASKCMESDANVTKMPVPDKHLTISGTLMTTNIIMANWSKAMWQGVVNRAVRMLASDPFGSHFFSAIATVGEN